MNLQKMADEVYEVNKANGWFDEDRGYAADIALLHSEVSEAFEAYRDHGFEDATAPIQRRSDCPLSLWETTRGFELGVPQPKCSCPLPKPEGVGSELADVLIRLLDTAKRRGWDLERLQRGAYWTSASGDADFVTLIADMHGDITYVGQAEAESALARLRATTLYETLSKAAQVAGVDLEAEYTRKIAFNRTRGHRHGGKRL